MGNDGKKVVKKSGIGKFVLGAAVGAGLGVLFAPRKGSETRKLLKEKMDDLVHKAQEIDLADVKLAIEEKIEEIKYELSDLDKEKVLDIAKEKANQIKEKTEELVTYAKDKATPVLQDAAEEVRKQAVKVVKEVLAKLEKKDK